MNYYDPDSLRLLTREHHDQRLGEADVQRLARELRQKSQRGRRWLTFRFTLNTDRRAGHPTLEA
jgi:hypothetical protein